MFTGLIQEVGAVRRLERRAGFLRLQVGYDDRLGRLRTGDSMAVNGVCLTATEVAPGAFTADLSGETQRLTTLGALRVGGRVNLERPVTAADPLGGHVVLGHVDGVGTLRRARRGRAGLELLVAAPAAVMELVVPRGSIAVDGVSLTAGEVGRDAFSLHLIPETVARTTLGARAAGEAVNLEADYLAKLVRKFLERTSPGAGRGAAGRPLDH